jgi:pyruvyltransferase
VADTLTGPRVFSWNPVRPVLPGRLGARVPVRRPVNNFGDLLGPLVVELMLRERGAVPARSRTRPRFRSRSRQTLFSVGSVLHFAADGDVVWGAGVNGKADRSLHAFRDLDVRAVRGPLSRAFLTAHGIAAPAVYGDPALLLPDLLPGLRRLAGTKAHRLTVVPNINDVDRYETGSADTLHPRSPLRHCLRRIAQSDLVVGSSLHGIVVAESLGIPARLVRSGAEPGFKYEDYYGGTGRPDFTPAASVAEAVRLGGEPAPRWSPEPLRQAFPFDLWGLT